MEGEIMLQEIAKTIAHFHFQTVHFPIALSFASCFVFALGFLGKGEKKEKLLHAGRVLLYLGTLGALVAMSTGLLAESSIPHHHEGEAHEIMESHEMLGVIIASSLSVLSLISLFSEKKKKTGARKIVFLLLLIIAGFVGYTGYLGGRLGHEFGIGVSGQETKEGLE